MPTLNVQFEPWGTCRAEAEPLWRPHYEEVGQDKARMRLDPDLALLDKIDSHGRLHCVTVRDGNELVGYHASLIEPLLHYKGVLAAKGDLYYLRPDMRRGRAAVTMFQEVERTCRARGVHVLYDATKLAADCGPLFDYLGYRAIERRYSKWIGEP